MTAGILLIAIPGGLALALAYGTLAAAAGLATGVIPTASAISAATMDLARRASIRPA